MNKLFKSRSAQLFLNCRLVILANFEGLRDYVWFNFKRFCRHFEKFSKKINQKIKAKPSLLRSWLLFQRSVRGIFELGVYCWR